VTPVSNGATAFESRRGLRPEVAVARALHAAGERRISLGPSHGERSLIGVQGAGSKPCQPWALAGSTPVAHPSNREILARRVYRTGIQTVERDGDRYFLTIQNRAYQSEVEVDAFTARRYYCHLRDIPVYVYAWGNNERRAQLKGRQCIVVARGALGTILVRFLDTGEQVTTSHRAIRPRP